MLRKIIIAVMGIVFIVAIGLVVYYLHFTSHLKDGEGNFQPLTHNHILQDPEDIAGEVAGSLHAAAKEVDAATKATLDRVVESSEINRASKSKSSSSSTNNYSRKTKVVNVHNYGQGEESGSVSGEQNNQDAISKASETTEKEANQQQISKTAIPSKMQMTLQKSKAIAATELEKFKSTTKKEVAKVETKSQSKPMPNSKPTPITMLQPIRKDSLPTEADMKKVIATDKNLLIAVGSLKYQQNSMVLHTLNSGSLGYLRQTSKVKKGDLLYKLGNMALEHKLIQAEKKETQLKQQMQQYNGEAKNLTLAKKAADLRLKLLLVQAEIFAYKNSLKQSNFYAPFPGNFIRAKDLNVGSQIQVGTRLGTLNGKEQLTAVGMVSAVNKNHLVLGQPVLITSIKDKEKVYPAFITSIDNNSDHGYIVHAVLEGDSSQLHAGSFVSMHVLLP